MPHAGSPNFRARTFGILAQLGPVRAKKRSPSWGTPSPSFAPLLHCSYAADLYRDGAPIRNNPYDIFNIQTGLAFERYGASVRARPSTAGVGAERRRPALQRHLCDQSCAPQSESPTASVGRQVGPHPEERKVWLARVEGISALLALGSG